MFLVGRSRELAELNDSLERAAGGHGGAVLLSGEPGIGKTRLAEAAAHQASDLGFEVVWGRCREDPGAPPYWPWVQVLRAVVGSRGGAALGPKESDAARRLADLIPEALEDRPDLADVSPPPSDDARFYLFDAFSQCLRRLVRERPLLLVLDDLHAADMPSLLLLEAVALELGDRPIAIVGTYREVEAARDAEVSRLLAVVAKTGSHLPVRGLTRDDVETLVREGFGIEPRAELVETVHRVTSGNPFFLDEMLRQLAAEGHLDADPTDWSTNLQTSVPESVRAAVRSRLTPLGHECIALLRVAAVAGRQFEFACVETASRSPRASVVGALERAKKEHVVDLVPGAIATYSFRHDLIRETLYDDVAELELVALHRSVSDALVAVHRTELGPVLSAIAHHYRRAALDGDASGAVEYSLLAGARACSLLAYEEATRHFESALEALDLDRNPEPEKRLELLLALGDARARAGETPAARKVFLDAARIAGQIRSGEMLARAALGMGGPWVEIGHVDSVLVSLLEQALELLGEDRPLLRAQVMARLARELYWSEQADRRLALARGAVATARRLEDASTLAAALTAEVYALWHPDKLEERLRLEDEIVKLAEESGDREMLLRGRLWRLSDTLEQGDARAVEIETEEYAQIADELRQPIYRWYAPRNRAMRALLSGRFDEAEKLTSEAFAIGARAHEGLAGQALAILTVLTRWERGDIHELAQMLETYRERYPTVAAWQCGAAFLHAEQGRIEEARTEFDAIARRGFDQIPRDATWILSVSLLALLCADLEDARRAPDLYRLLEPYGGHNVVIGRALVCFGSASHFLGILARTVGDWADAERHLGTALEMHRRLEARPWIARTIAEQARVRLDRDDREEGERLATEALGSARTLGMVGLAGRIERMLTGAGLTVEVESKPGNADSVRDTNTFERRGEMWTIAFEADRFQLRDRKGLRHIAALLARPGEEIHVLELQTSAIGADVPHDLREAGLRVGRAEDDMALLDDRARSEYKARLGALQSQIDEATDLGDLERAARAREEFDLIGEQLARAVGLAGRDRRSGSRSERARVNATKLIRGALQLIQAESPALGDHLTRTLRTGVYCSYNPDPRLPVSWKL